MKKIISVACAALMATSVVGFSGCFKKAKTDPMTRVTVDVNPSVEFLVDKNNKVVSATALNDDAGILLVGEAFVGKTSEEAVEMMLSLATDTGYLVKGNIEASENTVSISVTGNTKVAKELMDNVKAAATETLEELDIDGKVEEVAALAMDELRELAEEVTEYTEEQLEDFDVNELNTAIAQARVETALLFSEEMREAYIYAKEYELSFAEREETAAMIEAMGLAYKVTHATYKAAVTTYSTAIKKVDEFRYETFVKPDSDYQKMLDNLRDAKVDFLKKRTFKASLTIDDENYLEVSSSLSMSEQNYNSLLSSLESFGRAMNESLVKLLDVMKSAEKALVGLEKTMFTGKIKRTLRRNANKMQTTLNKVKDEFFETFEAVHADDIEAMQQALLAKKQELQAANSNA